MRIEFNYEIMSVSTVRWYYDSKSIFFTDMGGTVYQFHCTCFTERDDILQKLRDTGYVQLNGKVDVVV